MRIIFCFLLFLVVLLAVGCNGADYAAPDTATRVSIQGLRSLAIKISKDGLYDPDPHVRNGAIGVVSTAKIIHLMPDVVRLLNDEMVPVRFSAVLAVGDTRYEAALGAVKKMLNDEDENIQIAAAYSLAKLGDDRFIGLIRVAMKNADPTIAANAALLLGKGGDKRALPMLYRAKDNIDSADKVRFQAAESIAMLGDNDVYPRIWTMLLSKYANVRITGIRAMGALEKQKAINALITLLDDPVVEVRLAAAGQLGSLGDNSGEIVVAKYFTKPSGKSDKGSKERQAVFATLAIGQIGAEQLKRHLPKLLRSKSQLVRIAAAESVLLLAD